MCIITSPVPIRIQVFYAAPSRSTTVIFFSFRAFSICSPSAPAALCEDALHITKKSAMPLPPLASMTEMFSAFLSAARRARKIACCLEVMFGGLRCKVCFAV